MKKNISRNPLWPDWYNGKKIDEVQFGRAFSGTVAAEMRQRNAVHAGRPGGG